MKTFTYVYVLQSEMDSGRFYTGCTLDLRKRLARHNNGEVPRTSQNGGRGKSKPTSLFRTECRLRLSNIILKSASGRAFLKKRQAQKPQAELKPHKSRRHWSDVRSADGRIRRGEGQMSETRRSLLQ
jgi:putative endonuclease